MRNENKVFILKVSCPMAIFSQKIVMYNEQITT